MLLSEIQGQMTSLRQYIETELGFDEIISCDLLIQHDEKFRLDISAGDKFQRKRDYNERVGRLGIWEPGNDLGTIFAEVWRRVSTHMRRDERELRFGLAQLGDTLEGDQFSTEVGRMIYQRMKKVRDEISANYLPRFEGSAKLDGGGASPIGASGG